MAGLDPDDRGWALSLRLTLEERDALLRAFTSDDERASIEVRREITVAAPVVPVAPADDGPMVGPLIGQKASVLLPVIDFKTVMGPIFVPIEHVEPPPVPVPVEPDDQPIIASAVVSEVAPQVDLLSVARPLSAVRMTRLAANPDLIAVQPRARTIDFKRGLAARGRSEVFDPFGELVVEGLPPPPPPEELFTTTTTTVTQAVPLRFDVATHPYLFPSGRAESVAAEYELIALPWEGEGPGGRLHVYCQDLSTPDLFRYLPDAFLVGTLAQPPHGPELLFSVGRREDNPTEDIGIVSVHLVPQTSAERLADAREKLGTHIPIRPGTQPQPRLEPMLVQAQGHLQLPGGEEIDEVDVNLITGWWLTKSFPYDALQEAYAVLSTSGVASSLLRGHVSVDVDDQSVQIPLEVRLDRPATPALTWTTAGTDDGNVALTLRNVGPDPVVIPSVTAWLSHEDDLVPAVVADPGWPVTVASTAERILMLQADGGLDPGVTEADVSVVLDLTAARVEFTPESAVERTLDDRVTQLPRAVHAKTTVETLTQLDLTSIDLEFDDALISLTPTQPEVDVLVPVPLMEILLGRSEGTYRYKQTLFHRAGGHTADTQWRTATGHLLPIPAS